MLTVYGLVDPDSRRILYIGVSVDPDQRLKQHMSEGRRLCKTHPNELRCWLASLARENKTPLIVVLDRGDDADMLESEVAWINLVRSKGPLYNLNDGGCGRRLGRLGAPSVGAPMMRGRPKAPAFRVEPRQKVAAMTPEELKAIRQRHSWTQLELANYTNLSVEIIDCWERGKGLIDEYYAKQFRAIDIAAGDDHIPRRFPDPS